MRLIYLNSKNFLFCLTLLFLSPSLLKAQSFEWANRIGGSGNDYGFSVATDDAGNVFYTGTFQGIFIRKVTSSGNPVWSLNFGSPSNSGGNNILVDAGFVYCIGTFSDTMDFDPGPASFIMISHRYQDMFILKLDTAGNFIWARQFGGPHAAEGNSLQMDASGHLYASGIFQDSLYYGAGTSVLQELHQGPVQSWNTLICCFDTTGNLIWTRGIGGANQTIVNDMAVDNAGNIVLIGDFAGSGDFDPGIGTHTLTSTGYDCFIVKLDATGNYLWSHKLGGVGNFDLSKSLVIDNVGSVYMTGQFTDIVDFDPGNLTFFMNYIWGLMYIWKLDASGNFIWAKQLGLGGSAIAEDLAIDSSNMIFAIGPFNGNTDFDPGPGTNILVTAGSRDVFVFKMDSSGSTLWAVGFGGPAQDWGYGIAIDGTGNIYSTGNFMDSADFDPGAGIYTLSSAGIGDIFLQKMSLIPVVVKKYFTSLPVKAYPNPVQETITVDLPDDFHCTGFEISNVLSQVLVRKSVRQEKKLQVDIPGPKGLYLLTLTDVHQRKITVRVVKK